MDSWSIRSNTLSYLQKNGRKDLESIITHLYFTLLKNESDKYIDLQIENVDEASLADFSNQYTIDIISSIETANNIKILKWIICSKDDNRRFQSEFIWNTLIQYQFYPNNPFRCQNLSQNYIDTRELILLLRNYISPNSYELTLTNEIVSKIQTIMKKSRMGGFGENIEDEIEKLSNICYKKGGETYKMFNIAGRIPIHGKCKRPIIQKRGDPLRRVCFKCKKEIPQTVIWDNVRDWSPDEEKKIICECGHIFRVHTLVCRNCNPQDNFGSYINPRDEKELYFSPLIVKFEPSFFNRILKGLSYEQEIYHKLIQIFPTNLVNLSTLVKTKNNLNYGIEVDILFVEKLKGDIRREKYDLWAIEAKNWEKLVDKKTIVKFYEDVSEITSNLIFCSKKGFEEDAIQYAKKKKILLVIDTDFSPIFFQSG